MDLVCLIDDICLKGLCHVIFISQPLEKWCIIHKLINYLTAKAVITGNTLTLSV